MYLFMRFVLLHRWGPWWQRRLNFSTGPPTSGLARPTVVHTRSPCQPPGTSVRICATCRASSATTRAGWAWLAIGRIRRSPLTPDPRAAFPCVCHPWKLQRCLKHRRNWSMYVRLRLVGENRRKIRKNKKTRVRTPAEQ